MLGYRNTPAGPGMLQPGMACLARSGPPRAGGRDRPVAVPSAVAGPRRSGPEAPSVQVSLALVSSVRNRS